MAACIALVAHDIQKGRMVEWAASNAGVLRNFHIFATGSTYRRLIETGNLQIERLKNGPLGGDAQIGAMIVERKLDALFFFIDPMAAVPQDVDVTSLLRLAVLYDTPLAVNRTSATAILATLINEGTTT